MKSRVGAGGFFGKPLEKRDRVGAGVVGMWGWGPCGRPLGGITDPAPIPTHIPSVELRPGKELSTQTIAE